MTSVQVAVDFMAAINSRDLDKIAAALTENHTFIDGPGHVIKGRENARQAWESQFLVCPDYQIDHEDMFAERNLVAIFGTAAGTIHDIAWRTPVAWRVLVKDDLVHEWRVYSDTKLINDALKSGGSRA